MINIQDKEKCCGWTACASICPKKCIEMKPDFEGFVYPIVDRSNCVNCGLCEKVCPILNTRDINNWTRTSFIIRAKETDVLMDSTSGGFFTPIAREILSRGGVVCGAAYNDDFTVSHLIIDTAENIEQKLSSFRGAKYVQSSMEGVFQKIENYLKKNRMVLFVGTTCQVSGLCAFLRKDYANLICIDLVCHGTPFPKLWQKYLDYQRAKYHSSITKVYFRYKTYGYHSGTMRIEFKNGKIYHGSARVDYMLKSFFQEISSRPSCYECAFKRLERCSDFRVYDCWHASELCSDIQDDDKGYTNVIIQSEKGLKLLKSLESYYFMHPVDTEVAIRMDGIMVRGSAVPHPLRKAYYENLDVESLNDHIQKFIPVSRKDYFIENIKVYLYKTGIFGVIKKIIK